jgi:hypothetical protein
MDNRWTYMGRLEESLPLMRQFVRGAIGEMTNAQLRAAERAIRPRRYTGESTASEVTLWRLDQELLEARDFLRSIDDGAVDHLFRDDAGMKEGVRAAMHEHFRTTFTLRLRADPEIVEYPDGRFAHIEVAARLASKH